MCSFVKVLLFVYPHLENIIGDMDKLVYLKAYTSFDANAERAAARILHIIDKKDRLISLKSSLDELLATYSDEESWLLEQKYFKRKRYIKKYLQAVEIDFSLRTYFRKQARVLEKTARKLSSCGMNESWFLKNYGDIEWIMSFYERLKQTEEQKLTA